MTFASRAAFIRTLANFLNAFRAGRRYAGRVSMCTENKQQEKKYWEDSFHSWLILFCGCRVEDKSGRIRRVKRYWETVRDNLRKAGWNCGCISSTDHEGRQFWVAAAKRESISWHLAPYVPMPIWPNVCSENVKHSSFDSFTRMFSRARYNGVPAT